MPFRQSRPFLRPPTQIACLALLSFLLCACERYPRDPQDSLESILASGTLEVGLMEAPPWVERFDSGPPKGVEVRLLEAFAAELGVELRWHRDSMENLFEALKRQEVHLLAGGFTDSNPWRAHAGFTLPYYLTFRDEGWRTKELRHVMAATRGENALIMRLERFLLEGRGRDIVTGMMEEGRTP